MNLAIGVPASGVRDTRSLHEHNNAIKLRRNTSRWLPHPRVHTSPEVGPGATVGTPGLGYPLLLCLGKGLVVILDYKAKQPDPCGPESGSPDNGLGPVSRMGKVQEHRVSRKRQALSTNSRGSGPPVESRPPE